MSGLGSRKLPFLPYHTSGSPGRTHTCDPIAIGRAFCAGVGVNTINSLFSALATGALVATSASGQGIALRPLTGVNTAADELAARPDGEALTFVRAGGFAAAHAPGLRWLSFNRADAGEMAPAAATLSASHELNDLEPVSSSTSAQGDGIAVARRRLTPGGRTVHEIALSRRGRLDYLAAYDFPHNDVRFNSTDPALHADGRRMIFASDRPGGYGGYDLYYTEHGDGGWSSPVNLGPEVNSPGDERACFWGDDGLIAFASNRRGGLGGFDLYTVDASAPTWSAPRHLGLPFNTESDDSYFAYDRSTGRGVLASNRPGGRGGFDVYAFDLPAGADHGLAWLPAYTPASMLPVYSPRQEAFASAESALRHLRRSELRDDVEVEIELSADNGVATSLVHDLALGYDRLATEAQRASFRLRQASFELVAGLTEVGCARVLDDCETALAGDAGVEPMLLAEARSTIEEAGSPAGGKLRVRMTFAYEPAGGATALAGE